MTVSELRDIQEAALVNMRAVIAQKFPGCTEWHWYRACSTVKGKNTQRNIDQSNDIALAADEAIRNAYDSYISKLHAFYYARDGEHGVLGDRVKH